MLTVDFTLVTSVPTKFVSDVSQAITWFLNPPSAFLIAKSLPTFTIIKPLRSVKVLILNFSLSRDFY